jgi:hypothetical protein
VSAPKPLTPLAYVYDGRQCLGHVLARGKGAFEGFDAHENSLGLFSSARQAANACVLAAGDKEGGP